jgi:hypothetical protein
MLVSKKIIFATQELATRGWQGVSMEADKTYFARRAVEERAAAARSSDNSGRAHLEMAFRYEDLARAIECREYELGLDLFDDEPGATLMPLQAVSEARHQ